MIGVNAHTYDTIVVIEGDMFINTESVSSRDYRLYLLPCKEASSAKVVVMSVLFDFELSQGCLYGHGWCFRSSCLCIHGA